MKLFGRELTIKQVIGFVKCNAGSGDGLMDVAALELAGELEKVQAENTHLAKEVSSLAIESIEREKALARLEAEVMAAAESYQSGKWEKRPAGHYRCSVCNQVEWETEACKYCCNCGARMEVEE